jgi:hypothetical protein
MVATALVATALVATALVAVAGSASAQTPSAPSAALGREPQSIQVKPENVGLNNYLHDLVGPGAFVGVIGGGVLDQLRHKSDVPDDLAGKIGARAAQAAVEVSVHHGLAAAMHVSTSHQPCHCHGFGNKVGHALLESFTDRRDDGSRALAIPRFAGSYASSFTELAWNHNRNAGDVLRGTTMSFGVSALFNVGKELTGLAR